MGCHASSPRARRRLLEIQQAACHLVIDRGYDGFTMDDLAVAVGVSRRTLFNYIPDKKSAVLGPMNELTSPAVDAFRSGQPSGKLLPDLVATLDQIIDEVDAEGVDHDGNHQSLVNQAIAADPKVLAIVAERMTALTAILSDAVCERQGWARDDLRARALATQFLALIKLTLEELEARSINDARAFQSVFHEILAADAAIRAES